MKAEPTVGILAVAGKVVGFNFKVTRDHNQLVDEALDAFTKAEKKMEGAINTINQQIADEEKAIAEARERVASASGSKDKLSRVLDRVRALTA